MDNKKKQEDEDDGIEDEDKLMELTLENTLYNKIYWKQDN